MIGHLGSDFGELEDPTPWEVQEAIRRIKVRERRHGAEQAKSEVTNLRSYEYVEMEQRVRAAMQRISELESIVQRDPGLRGGGGTPVRSSLGPSGNSNGSNHGPFASAIAQAGLDRSPMRTDDVRIGVRDKSLRRGMKGSPRSSFGRLDT